MTSHARLSQKMIKKTAVMLTTSQIVMAVSPAFAETATDVERRMAQRSQVQQAVYQLVAEASDFDKDGSIEAPPMKTATFGPTDGGIIPDTSGAPKTDGYDGYLGYCSWDIGSSKSSTGRLVGSTGAGAVAIAIISYGLDNTFQTSCAQIADGLGPQADDYAFWMTANQMGAGNSTNVSLYWGAPLETEAALDKLDKSTLHEGEVRLIKESNKLYRWSIADAKWAIVSDQAPWQQASTDGVTSGAFFEEKVAIGQNYLGQDMLTIHGGVEGALGLKGNTPRVGTTIYSSDGTAVNAFLGFDSTSKKLVLSSATGALSVELGGKEKLLVSADGALALNGSTVFDAQRNLTANSGKFTSSVSGASFLVGTTTVIDASRNLVNIGNLQASGAATVGSLRIGTVEAISSAREASFTSLAVQGNGTFSGAINVTGTVTAPTFNGALNGNAATAAKLLNKYTISATGDAAWSTAFDGTGNATGTLTLASSMVPARAQYLGSGKDLNDYKLAGFYYQDANAYAANGANYPELRAGSLVVQTAAGITQQYYTYNDGSPAAYFRGFYNGAWSPWTTVIDSSNVKNYVPSLTGEGASGTWKINVTGSAGSVNGLTLNNSANPINPDSVTQNQIGYANGLSLLGQIDGGLYSSAYSSAWIHQIYGDFRTGQMAVRGKNNGAWQPWRTVLDSGNAGYAARLNQDLRTTDSVKFNTIAATNNGNGTNFQIGDDAWLGDVNIANTTQLMGMKNNDSAYLIFGNANSLALGRTGSGPLTYGGNEVLHSGNVRSYAPSRTGEGASGTWNINVTGSAGSVAWNNVTGRPTTIAGLTGGDSIGANPNNRVGSGFYETSTAWKGNGWPADTGAWYHLLSSTHSNGSNYYAMQLASDFYSQRLFYRSTAGAGDRAWNEILHTGNYSNYAMPINGGVNANFDIASNSNHSGYASAAIEIRELNHGGSMSGAQSEAPRLAFHWGGRVASQIAIDTDGTIMIRNNPGNGFEKFSASSITANGNLTATGNLNLTATNPQIITGGGYVIIPNGAYFSGGTVYVENQLQARGGVNNDKGNLRLSAQGGTIVNTNQMQLAEVATSGWSCEVPGAIARDSYNNVYVCK